MLLSCFCKGYSQQYTIKGTIKNKSEGSISLFGKLEETQQMSVNPKAMSELKSDGTFVLSGNVASSQIGTLSYNDDNAIYETHLFIEAGTTEISLEIDTNGAIMNGYGIISITSLSGTPNNKVLGQYKKNISALDENSKIKGLSSLQRELSEQFGSGGMDTVKIKNLRAKITDASDFYISQVKKIQKELYESSKGSLAALYLIVTEGNGIENLGYTLQEKQNFLNIADPNARVSRYYKLLQENVDQYLAIQPGKTVRDFTLKDEKGQNISIDSFRGNYVLLDFWAYYCAPCIAAFPQLKKIYSKYQGKGLEMISISVDTETTPWQNALKKHQNPWVQLIDTPLEPDSLKAKVSNGYFQVQFMPTYVLLNKKGEIVTYTLEESEIEKSLRTIFNF